MQSTDDVGNMGKTVDRRAFVRGVGVAGLGVAGAAFVGGELGILDRIPGINKAGLASAAV
jgi:hypothetical protein